jgi:hypothetical protein
MFSQQSTTPRKRLYSFKSTTKRFRLTPTTCLIVIVFCVCLLVAGQVAMLRNAVSNLDMQSAVASVHRVATPIKNQDNNNNNNQAAARQSAQPRQTNPAPPLPKSFPSAPSSFFYDHPPPLSAYPKWIQDYVTWHQQVRRQFPGMELFTNPKAPNVLVRTCLGLCGGLHDRLGQLPWDLYLANATNRVLLVAWQRPRSLENFFIPSESLDWSVPLEAEFGFDDIRLVRNHTNLFQGYPEDRPAQDFWNHDVDAALERANTGEYKDVKILRHRILGHLGEADLEARLSKVGYSEALHAAPLFGNIFWLFFRPSPEVQTEVTTILSNLQLRLYKYSAVHCRVRHPKAFEYGNHVLGKNPRYPADKTGLPWEGQTRQFALEVAAQAIECSRDIAPTNPIYFLSDSNDLARHVTIELIDEQFVKANRSEVDWNLHRIVQGPTSVLGRDVTLETAHLDRQKGRPADAYYSTFIDLLLAVHASCVVYGVGYYASFASKISGTNCSYTYAQEAWGQQAEKSAHFCPHHPAAVAAGKIPK